MHLDPAACAAILEAPPAPTVTQDRQPIVVFLEAAKARGLKYPKARFLAPGELKLSVAGEQASVPGSIQVVVREQWIGRIEPSGRVVGRLESDTVVLEALNRIAADPATAAREYGALMGRCSFCDTPIRRISRGWLRAHLREALRPAASSQGNPRPFSSIRGMTMANRETAHISTVARQDNRAITERVTRITWCGAAPTAADVTPSQASRWVRSASTQGPHRCETCFRKLLDADFNRSARVED